jgi:hypothetical protein
VVDSAPAPAGRNVEEEDEILTHGSFPLASEVRVARFDSPRAETTSLKPNSTKGLQAIGHLLYLNIGDLRSSRFSRRRD